MTGAQRVLSGEITAQMSRRRAGLEPDLARLLALEYG